MNNETPGKYLPNANGISRRATSKLREAQHGQANIEQVSFSWL
jgi:hypothetical protein